MQQWTITRTLQKYTEERIVTRDAIKAINSFKKLKQ